MQVYFITGLGADKSVFQLLRLNYCAPIFVDWIKPMRKETLQHYALRLVDEYNIPFNAVIVGLSFGGMLATEIAKACPAAKVILLSSAKTAKEIPAFYKLGKYLPVYKWVPAGIQKLIMLAQEGRFGVRSTQGKLIYRQVVKQADISFNTWAIWALIHWNNKYIPPTITHIHGTNDKILPYKLVKANITLMHGGHLMVMENAGAVSDILEEVIGC